MTPNKGIKHEAIHAIIYGKRVAVRVIKDHGMGTCDVERLSDGECFRVSGLEQDRSTMPGGFELLTHPDTGRYAWHYRVGGVGPWVDTRARAVAGAWRQISTVSRPVKPTGKE